MSLFSKVLLGTSLFFMLSTIVLLIREKFINLTLDEMIEYDKKKRESVKLSKEIKREKERKKLIYKLSRYERVKNAEALSSIPFHYTRHTDGMTWHQSKIKKCFVIYFSGLENRYATLLLDKNNTITNDNRHATEELCISLDKWITTNRTPKSSDSKYVTFNLLKEEDMIKLRKSGVEILVYNKNWIPEEVSLMPRFKSI